jgi:hypothetical protein
MGLEDADRVIAVSAMFAGTDFQQLNQGCCRESRE